MPPTTALALTFFSLFNTRRIQKPHETPFAVALTSRLLFTMDPKLPGEEIARSCYTAGTVSLGPTPVGDRNKTKSFRGAMEHCSE